MRRGKAQRSDTELAYDRLQHLYEISTLLTTFESVEGTVPAVIELIARTLPLRSAIFLHESETPGKPRKIIWQLDRENEHALKMATLHAKRSYAYLVRSEATTGATAQEVELLLSTRAKRKYLLLPLVTDTGSIFGALQLEGIRDFEERDLVFVDAVVNQIAVAIDRQAMLDARQRATERARAAAERAREMIRDQVAFARDVTASLGEGVIATDLDMRITLFNPAAEELVHCKAEDVLGKRVDDVVRIRRGDSVIGGENGHPFAVVMSCGQSVRSDDSLLSCKDFAPIPVSYTCCPLRRDGKVSGAVLAFRDIVDVKLAEKKQRVLADVGAILASSLDYRETLSAVARFAVPLLADLCFIDEMGEDGTPRRLEIVFADDHKQQDLTERITRYCPGPGSETPQARVIEGGKSVLFSEIQDPAGIAHDSEHADVLREAGLKSMLVVPLLARGRTLGALTFGTAESDRRYTTSDLALAEEIAHRAALAIDNARLYERAQRATRSRDELLAVVSHDLKNPVGAILMGVTMMLEVDNGANEMTKRRLASIKHAAKRMDRLIQDLLDTATIEAGRLSIELRRVQVPLLVADTLEALSPLAITKSIRIKTELPAELPPVAADAGRLEQVLANLLGNALKFTPEGGEITIGAECSEQSVVFSVTDTGPGMGQEELEHLFDRFWQARRTAALGTGLGLFIVKGIIEAHGGKVWVESTIGVGSTFFFELPVLPPELCWLVDDETRIGELRADDLRSAIDKHARGIRDLEVGRRDPRALLASRAAREVAKRATGLKSSVMEVVSQELSGPLTTLELLIERLQRSRENPPSPSQQQIIRRMFAAVGRMSATVESVLQYGLLQDGHLRTRIDSFDLRALVREVLDQLRPYAEEKHIALRVIAQSGLLPLRSDRDLVRLILLNLVGNAIKVTDQGSVAVVLECSSGAHRLAVTDAGPGIPAEQRVRIFEPFAKVPNDKLNYAPGMGLGLTLVRDLATALGGRIQLDSEVGRGSTLTVTLPPASSAVQTQQLPLH